MTNCWPSWKASDYAESQRSPGPADRRIPANSRHNPGLGILPDYADIGISGHSAASILNEGTGNLKLAQKLLGHSNVEITAEVYTHTSAEAEREAALAIERAIYGDLFPVVPNSGNRNNSAAIQ